MYSTRWAITPIPTVPTIPIDRSRAASPRCRSRQQRTARKTNAELRTPGRSVVAASQSVAVDASDRAKYNYFLYAHGRRSPSFSSSHERNSRCNIEHQMKRRPAAAGRRCCCRAHGRRESAAVGGQLAGARSACFAMRHRRILCLFDSGLLLIHMERQAVDDPRSRIQVAVGRVESSTRRIDGTVDVRPFRS
jgi:hypothetical protein